MAEPIYRLPAYGREGGLCTVRRGELAPSAYAGDVIATVTADDLFAF